ncbi:DinB family protein [Thalassospira australica]|uniref:DinB family protein n=1 Tax=Thalassospira australica TaxID=1528106 RepID=UPI00051A5B54|nr:DinB family protein [Thalassospira australica]
MNGAAYFERMAQYNIWANGHAYDACAKLPQSELIAPRTAFFPSILRTLNHLVVADQLWMGRLLGTPVTMALDTVLYENFDELRTARHEQDQVILEFTRGLTDSDVTSDLTYQSVSAGAYTMPRDLILAHMFNHQTHHRGQLSNMLLEAGSGPLEIDLIYYGREQL